MNRLTRREILASLAALGVAPVMGLPPMLATSHAAETGLTFDADRAFSFDRLAEEAQKLASKPYVPEEIRAGDILSQIDFDAHWKIKYRADATLDVNGTGAKPGSKSSVRFFHLGQYFQLPVNIHVVEGNHSRKLGYDPDLFEMPADSVAHRLPDDIGFGGFRVLDENPESDWLAFLGAAYFRSSGELGQYGLSARAVAVDVAMPTPEEFPRFTDFYLGPSESGERDLTIYCPFNSARMAGVLKMDVGKSGPVIMDIETRIFARNDIDRVGLAPLTSMFWFSETDRLRRVDWRPEVHDSDGLAMWTGGGERIWRPLNNPTSVITSSFTDKNPKGFGLLQRDRSFSSYEDDGVFYDRRPSLWVEPKGQWGPGVVQLVEIPTDDEIHDNIVAYWVSDKPVKTGDAIALDYRLTWSKDEPYVPDVSTVTSTRLGRGGVAGQARPKDVTKIAVDFDHGKVAKLDRQAEGVEAVVTTSRGTISNIFPHSVKVGTAWRLTFDLKADGTDPVDVRAYLKRGEEFLTETWLYQFLPTRDEEDGA